MKRRNFIKTTAALGILSTLPKVKLFGTDKNDKIDKQQIDANKEFNERLYWSKLLYRIAEPVLSNMSKGELRKNMPMEVSPIWDGRDKDVGYLEAFGRLIAGVAPWLNLLDNDSDEGKMRKQLREWSLKSIEHSVNPDSPDYMAWNTVRESQPLVDAAYVAHAFIRSPKALWEPLDDITKQRIIKEFKGLRRVRPPYNNWLLFAAMTESFLLMIGEEYDAYRIDFAIRKINEWYVGDGWYADGPKFGMDYYNGYVIHSMLIDVLGLYVLKAKRMPESVYNTALKRMQRYSEFLERIISPEASYPAFGRSITYRLGVFQPLVQLVLMEKLPDGISYSQVRCAITAVMKRMFSVNGNFDKDNFLQLGFVGYQPNLADYYTNTGSLYITSLGFSPLGLPENHEFWISAPEDWTAKKAWDGNSFNKDYAVNF